jgi:hypothetical protein
MLRLEYYYIFKVVYNLYILELKINHQVKSEVNKVMTKKYIIHILMYLINIIHFLYI